VPFLKENGEPIEEVNCFLEDREGSLWMGTKFDGLVRLRPRFIHMVTAKNGLNSENVFSVCQGHERTIWAGTGRNSFSRIRDGQVESFKIPEPEIFNVLSIFEDRAQNLWLGVAKPASSNSLYIMQPGGKPKRFNDQA